MKQTLTILSMISVSLSLCFTLMTQPVLAAQSMVVSEGTQVFVAFPEDLSSRKKDTHVGEIVEARVWRDVVVDDTVVVAEGSEILLRVADVKRARILGRKGRLELEAVSVRAVDGTDIPLTGSYGQKGRSRYVLTGVLTVAVAWPFAFLKGKHAKVSEGTIFETQVARAGTVLPTYAAD